MADVARQLVAEPLTAEAWAPFGWIPVADVDPSDGTHRLAFAWADPHVNVISHARRRDHPGRRGATVRADVSPRHPHPGPHGVDRSLGHRRGPRRCGFLETDRRGGRAGVPARGLRLLGAAPGHVALGPVPPRGRARPLFNVQGLRYAEDNAAVELAAKGIDLVVRGGS